MEEIADKIKETEKYLEQEENEETEEQKQERQEAEMNQRIDNAIINQEREKAEKEQREREELERSNMADEDPKSASQEPVIDDEGIDHSDPMNSLAGPKQEFFYDSVADPDEIVSAIIHNQGSGISNSGVKMYDNKHQARGDKEILDEIEKDVQKYILQGEWVYYLYSVLIHSGGVSGGHYSAYIRSFEDNQWYHFNDSRVSEISIGDIEEMHGNGSSSKNAYLVIYKKYRLKEENGVADVDKEYCPIITEDEIPQYLKDEVEKSNEEFREEEAARKIQEEIEREKRAHITARIFSKTQSDPNSVDNIWSNKVEITDPRVQITEKKIDFKNYQTVKEVHEELYKIFEFEQLGITLENTQLRMYNPGLKLLKHTLENSGEKSLKDVGIDMAHPVFLETKLPEEAFDFLSEDMKAIRIYPWKGEISSFEEENLNGNVIFVNSNNNLSDLEQDIYVYLMTRDELEEGQKIENMILLQEYFSSAGRLVDSLNRSSK